MSLDNPAATDVGTTPTTSEQPKPLTVSDLRGMSTTDIIARAQEMAAGTAPAVEALAPQNTAAAEQPATKPSLSWREAIESATPEQAALLKQMQADYTRKTTDLAQQRKALEAQAAALAAAKRAPPPAEATAALPDEVDVFDPASLNVYIEKRIADALAQREAPLLAKQREAEVLNAYQQFVAANPDVEADPVIAAEVDALLDANENLSLEHAYLIAKGKHGGRATPAPAAPAPNPARESRREAASQVARPGGTAPDTRLASPTGSDLRGMSSSDIYALAQRINAGR